MTPVEAKESPAGRLPEVVVHVKGGTPPEACKLVAAYTWFGTPPGRVVVVTVRGNGAPMAMVKGCVAEAPFESVTLMVKLESTCAVGVPEIVTERVVLLPSESPGCERARRDGPHEGRGAACGSHGGCVRAAEISGRQAGGRNLQRPRCAAAPVYPDACHKQGKE